MRESGEIRTIGKGDGTYQAQQGVDDAEEWTMQTCALVLGDLGTVGNFRSSIRALKLSMIDGLPVNCQYEVLFYAVRIHHRSCGKTLKR